MPSPPRIPLSLPPARARAPGKHALTQGAGLGLVFFHHRYRCRRPVTTTATSPTRHIHYSQPKPITEAPVGHDDPPGTPSLLTTATLPADLPLPSPSDPSASTSAMASFPPPSLPRPPLSVLPLSMILRNLVTSTVTASPALLPPSLALLSRLAHSSIVLNPDRNPALHLALKRTLYSQFCAGENAAEVAATINRLKQLGFSGVILSYGKEVVLRRSEAGGTVVVPEAQTAREIRAWKEGNLETVRLAQPGDFVALKFTGAGRQVYSSLAGRAPPPPALAAAVDEICALAVSRGVRLLVDAEQAAVQDGIDEWGLAYLRRHNIVPGRACIYLTYQAYLKQTPQTLRTHLEIARRDGFTLGVKLVRGAYLATDPRRLIHDTKADTDRAFDDLAAAVLARRWSPAVLPGSGPFPAVSVIIASHNAASVDRARAVVEAGQARTDDVAFAQLQGMADEVSCSLLVPAGDKAGAGKIGAYKYLVWGSTGDCMKYLLRRAEENRDAVQRTKEGRNAMWMEVVRRFRAMTGLA